MTGDDVKARAEYLLKNENRDKWTNTHFAAWINDGVQWILSNAPMSAYDTDGTILTITELTATGLSSTISIPDRWRECLAHYVCARCFEQDAGDKRDAGRAAMHMADCRQLAGLS